MISFDKAPMEMALRWYGCPYKKEHSLLQAILIQCMILCSNGSNYSENVSRKLAIHIMEFYYEGKEGQ